MMRFRIILGLAFILGLLSCKTDESKEKVYSMDDIMEGSNQKVTLKDTVIPKTPIDETFLKIANQLNLPSNELSSLDTILFVDRYENVANYKYSIPSKNKLRFIAHWNFDSKGASKNAFVNWLQCYGKNCNTLNLNDTISVSNEKMAMILSEDELFYLANISLEEYQSFVKSFVKERKLKEIDFTFYQNGKKGVKWFTFKDLVP